MTKNERKEIAYLALNDLYKELNSSVNHLLILREFLQELLNMEKDNTINSEYPSLLKYSKFRKQ